MDSDTILVSDKAANFVNYPSDFTLIYKHIGAISAKKNAKALQIWKREINRKIFLYKLYKNYPKIYRTFFSRRSISKFYLWDYFGNSIVNPLIERLGKKEIFSLDRQKIKALPEVNFYKNRDCNFQKKYIDFYFSKSDNSDYAINENHFGIILLHNSWTPKEYKLMSKDEFLKNNITLSNIFRKLLKEDL